jgi:hypothetical protein
MAATLGAFSIGGVVKNAWNAEASGNEPPAFNVSLAIDT